MINLYFKGKMIFAIFCFLFLIKYSFFNNHIIRFHIFYFSFLQISYNCVAVFLCFLHKVNKLFVSSKPAKSLKKRPIVYVPLVSQRKIILSWCCETIFAHFNITFFLYSVFIMYLELNKLCIWFWLIDYIKFLHKSLYKFGYSLLLNMHVMLFCFLQI